MASCLPLAAQNFDQPGQVWFDGRWGDPADAIQLGWFDYRGRWLPGSMRQKLRTWEREDGKRSGWGDSYSVKTGHYRVRTNLPRHVMELEVRPFLDALYEAYVKIYRERFGLEGKGSNHKAVHIYCGYGEYRAQTGRPRTNPGYIVSSSELHCLYELQDPGHFYKTAFHEGAHQFFGSLMPGASLPHWMTEALATWFEACTYSRATGRITFGSAPADRLRFAKMQLAGAEDPDPERMFMRFGQGDYTALHYALGWSFLHYLIEVQDGKYGKQFGKLLRELNGSGAKPFGKVFRDVFGDDLREVSKGWKAHVMAMEDPLERQWVRIKVGELGPGVDLREDDIVRSLRGIEIWTSGQFQEQWLDCQQKGQEFAITVLRQRPLEAFPGEWEWEELTQTVAPAQVVQVYGKGFQGRMTGLVD